MSERRDCGGYPAPGNTNRVSSVKTDAVRTFLEHDLKQPCVYLLASKRNGTLYVGVTSNLAQRVWQHKNDVADGFTKRYSIHTLVWFEPHEAMSIAVAREHAIKEWRRCQKLALIEESNPDWRDLYADLL